MGKIIRVLLVLAVVTAVIGHFRGWYSVSRVDEQTTTDIRVRIDRERIRQDLDVARERVDEVTDKLAPEPGETEAVRGSASNPEAAGILP